jgi:hypothetical protein
MKYIITESKLEQAIYQYIDNLFASQNGNTEIYKLPAIPAIPDTDEIIEGVYDFVNDDYYDGDNQDYLFSWTGREYYDNEKRKNYQSKGQKFIDLAPIVEIHDENKVYTLNLYFNEMWKPIFNKWFQDKVNLPIKTLYV